MKQNYRLTISYDGSRYHGWETKPNTDMTIQGKLEQVLSRMTGEPVKVIGAGRTDAGVHALAMTANVHLELCADIFPRAGQETRTNTPCASPSRAACTDPCTPLSQAAGTSPCSSLSQAPCAPPPQAGQARAETLLRDYLNRYLPEDICIREVKAVSERFHSRYNAAGKTYRYTCYDGPAKPVFGRKYVYTLEKSPDLERMRRAAVCLTGTHDFASFCGNPKMKKSTVRTVESIEIIRRDEYLSFTYRGDGFLYHMVRILTGTLLEVGFGMRAPESMESLLAAGQRSQAGFLAPAQGLCLLEVRY